MWEAAAAIATTLGVFGGIAAAIIKYFFAQQLKLEESRQQTAAAQKEAVEAEKKVYEVSLSQTVKEFNALRAQVKGRITLWVAHMQEIQTNIETLVKEFESNRAELARLNKIMKDYVERVDNRITNLEKKQEDFGKIILKPEATKP